MDLFNQEPLSYRMVPKTLDHYQGQEHLIGNNGPIKTMLEYKIIQSMIFYGPPASGKTALAKLIADHMQIEYLSVNALTLNNEEIRQIHDKANANREQQKKTLVFIDEIHRLTKPKQDAFLSSLESGLILLIGASTENPYFSLNPALRSRVLMFEFFPLQIKEKESILLRALAEDKFFEKIGVSLESDAKDFLLEYTSDPRNMLNVLETAVLTLPIAEVCITKKHLESMMQKTDTQYNTKDMHYDVVSAFIKSVRGSDPDAVLYYLALMIHSGEDPRFIFRRLMISAVEDVGMAYPEAINVVVSCAEAFERVGYPEGQLHLSHAALYLAGLPKSNTVLAIHDALRDVQQGKMMPIPSYLKDEHHFSNNKQNAPKYKYPHDYPNHFVKQKYTSGSPSYYFPSEQGFEKKIADRLKRLWE
ncbi:MAG: replication-associated recombination protein A [Brevinema sp.]